VGGYSYQDLDTRIKTLEQMVLFVMSSMRMKGMISTGLVGPDGQPQGKVIDGTLLDFYRLATRENLSPESLPSLEGAVKAALDENKTSISENG
jgi:hypothetical protein